MAPIEIVRCDLCWAEGRVEPAEGTCDVEGGISMDLCGPCLDQWLSALEYLGRGMRDPFPLPDATRSLLEDRASCVNRTH